MVFSSIVALYIRTHSPISRSTCPLNFLKYSNSFYPHILAHSSRTCSLIILKHSGSFYPHILTHTSRTFPLTFLKHSLSFYPYIYSLSFYPYIVAHYIRIYSLILVIHVHSLVSSILSLSINTISVISRRSVLLVEEAAIHWQTLSLNVVPLASSGIRTRNISGDRQTILRNTNRNPTFLKPYF